MKKNCRKLKLFLPSIMTLAMVSPANAQAETPQISVSGNPYDGTVNLISLYLNYEKSEMRNGLSCAIPVDLFEVGNKLKQLPSYYKGKQDTAAPESCRRSKNSAENLISFKAVTDDYGQLKSILEANKGNEIDSLAVVGPINKDDFKAIWDCAVYGNMQVLNLENATIENNAIPDYALYDPIQFESGFWLKIRRIILPEGVISIGKAAFPFMGLEEINIPSTVREIGSTAFGYDRWLNCELVIPEGVEEIKYQTFNECTRLTITPRLPKSLKKIGEHAFSMTRFDNLSFPDGLEEIGQGAFQDCGLSSVLLPNTCTSIGDMAFQLSKNIKEIVMPPNLESIPFGLFSMCDGLETLNINDNCRHIEEAAFMLCSNLREINFNQKLETIGYDAFYGCSLEILNFPHTLRQLGALSFGAMSNTLHEVRCAANIPPVCIENALYPGELPFTPPYEYEEFTLYVPYGTKDAYSSAWGWDCFFKIEETDDFPFAGFLDAEISEKIQDNSTYDLFGRKVESPVPGHLYIINGKKIIFK
ncbi:MAG: leucine-rich repeat domain-containing protein [Muribaculaceae bacterium]|nr:leucine-rich repeat domain-containing protein [Muribaculaceae bacterium]